MLNIVHFAESQNGIVEFLGKITIMQGFKPCTTISASRCIEIYRIAPGLRSQPIPWGWTSVRRVLIPKRYIYFIHITYPTSPYFRKLQFGIF